MQMNFELDLKKIEKDEKKKMLSSLLNYNMFYECNLMCELFIKNIEIKKEINILNDIIELCKTNQNKNKILQMIKEW